MRQEKKKMSDKCTCGWHERNEGVRLKIGYGPDSDVFLEGEVFPSRRAVRAVIEAGNEDYAGLLTTTITVLKDKGEPITLDGPIAIMSIDEHLAGSPPFNVVDLRMAASLPAGTSLYKSPTVSLYRAGGEVCWPLSAWWMRIDMSLEGTNIEVKFLYNGENCSLVACVLPEKGPFRGGTVHDGN